MYCAGVSPFWSRADTVGTQAAEFDTKFRKILASNKSHPYLLWAANLDDVVEAFQACMRRGDPASDEADAPMLPPAGKPAAVAVGTAERKTRRVLLSDPELDDMQIP